MRPKQHLKLWLFHEIPKYPPWISISSLKEFREADKKREVCAFPFWGLLQALPNKAWDPFSHKFRVSGYRDLGVQRERYYYRIWHLAQPEKSDKKFQDIKKNSKSDRIWNGLAQSRIGTVQNIFSEPCHSILSSSGPKFSRFSDIQITSTWAPIIVKDGFALGLQIYGTHQPDSETARSINDGID